MQLSEYFQPLGATTLGYFFVLFLSFDLWGTLIKSFLTKEQPDKSRTINWLIGLGFLSFVWFFLRFLFPPDQTRVALSVLVLDLFCLSYYLKHNEFRNLCAAWWQLKYPLLLVIPFLPAVFIKASLPPYYSDEMAYHFISPAKLSSLITWRFDGDFYPSLPQVFDYYFVLSFALTKTYAIARLTHFTILISAMLFAFGSLKRLFGRLPAYLFILAFFSLPQALVITATIGYVDVATYSFMLIGLLFLIDFFVSSSAPTLSLSAIFWGLALGTKYTTLSAAVSLVPAAFYLFLKNKIKISRLITPVVLLLLFGGYWYIKNLVAYGNPLYPMFATKTTINFTGNWTTPIDPAHFREILNNLLPHNPVLQVFIIIAPILISFSQKSKAKAVTFFLIVTLIIELFVLKYTSGFYARYHQHLQLWLLLLLALSAAAVYRHRLVNWLYQSAIVILTLTLIGSYVYSVKLTYNPSFLSPQETDYAFGKIDIYSWIEAEFPRVSPIIRWCENPPMGKTALYFVDPDMVWFEKDGLMRSFLTNCDLQKNIPLEGVALDNLASEAKKQQLKFFTPSINECLPDNLVGPKRVIKDDLDDRTIYLRHLSNWFLCHSQKIIPHLYYFDYENLNR